MCCRLHVACLSAAMVLIGSAFAQVPPRSPQPAPPGVPDGNHQPNYPGTVEGQQQPNDPLASDKAFVKRAVEGSIAEIELGKLAQEKSSTEAVKEVWKANGGGSLPSKCSLLRRPAAACSS
jgi:putative membrane protein